MKLKHTLHTRFKNSLKQRNHFSAGLLIALALIACQDVKRPEAPSNLIQQDAMVAILTEAYLMNAARSIDNRTIVNKGVLLDSILYSKYRIDSLQFSQSNAYYSSDLETYKDLFLRVQENLKVEKTKRDTLYAQYERTEKAKRIKDSIKEQRLDSMQKILPKIKRDSWSQLLEAADLKERSKNQKISIKE
jgi:hypothetical protein